MEDAKNFIRQFLDRSLFIKKERKEMILKGLDTYSEKKLEAIIRILKKAEEKELTAMETLSKKNPEFSYYSKNAHYQHFLEKLHRKEKKELEEEKEIIGQIELELETLNSDEKA